MFKTLTAQVHPGVWWLLGLSFAVAASLQDYWLPLAIICLTSVALASAGAAENAVRQTLRLYLILAILVVSVRVSFRVIFNFPDPTKPVFLNLPLINLDLGFGTLTSLFGPVSLASITSGFTDGLRLAAIILAVAMANSLANPKRLLKSTPAALYELATAAVVAINLAPQLIASLQRVRKARELRGRSRKVTALTGTIIPALEDTIDSSLDLAASMASRGFGRRGPVQAGQLSLARLLTFTALVAMIFAIFSMLSVGLSDLVTPLSFIIALIASLTSVKLASRHGVRTRFQAHTWAAADFAITGLSASILFVGFWFGG
jgi:energy-coupling factor transport system permease protein